MDGTTGIQEWVFAKLAAPERLWLRESQSELEQLNDYLCMTFEMANQPGDWLSVYQDLGDVAGDLAKLRWRLARAWNVVGQGPKASLAAIWAEWGTAWSVVSNHAPASDSVVGKALAAIAGCALAAFDLDPVVPDSQGRVPS